MILVSGATKGIGRAIVERFAREGFDVFAVARTANDLAQLKARLEEKYPIITINTFPGDLSSERVFEDLVLELDLINKPIRALINNLGIYQAGGILEEADVFLPLLQTNLLTAHRLTRAVFPFLDNQCGHLFTIGSVATIDFAAHMTAYAASKYALEGWHLAMEKELGNTAIKSTLVVPDATLTAAWEGVEKLPGRILAPEQVAAAVWEAFAAPIDQPTRRVELRLHS